MSKGKTLNGSKTLSGTWAEVWWNGARVLEMKKITAKVTVEREEVQLGLSKDSKITGLGGEGEMVVAKAFTRTRDMLEAYKRGEDIRVQIIAKLADPDATGKQTERWSFDNVWLTELPLVADWEKGGAIEETIPFGFTPEDAECLDAINES